MGLDIFPAKMNSVKASKHEKQLKIIRFVSLALVAFIFVWNFLSGSFDIFSISTWTVLFSLAFEIFAVLNYFVDKLDKVASILFLIAWSFNTTVVYMIFYFSTEFGFLDLLTYLPFTVLLVDFIYNKISFIRLQYIFPLGLLALQVFFLFDEIYYLTLLMSTLQGILLRVGIVVFCLAVLEISRLIKVRNCKENECEQSLL